MSLIDRFKKFSGNPPVISRTFLSMVFLILVISALYWSTVDSEYSWDDRIFINDSNLVIKELIEIYNEKGMEYLERNLDMSPSDIETWHISLKLHSIKQMADLVKLFYKWFNELLDFKSKTDKEMNELEIPEDQRFEFFLYSFMGSMKFNVVLKDED